MRNSRPIKALPIPTSGARRHLGQISFLAGFLCAAIAGCQISPLVVMYASLLILIAGSELLAKNSRLAIAAIVIVTGAITVASREHFTDPSDDLIRNFRNFELLTQGDFETVIQNEVGTELLYYLYLAVLAYLFPNLAPPGLILLSGITIATIFVWAVETEWLPSIDQKERGLALGTALLFYSFFTASQLTRQMLSSSIILFSLLSNSRLKSSIAFGLAFFIHNSALLTFLLAKVFVHLRMRYALATAAILAALIYVSTFSPVLTENPLLATLGIGRLGFWGETAPLKEFVFNAENGLLLGITLWCLATGTSSKREESLPRYLFGSAIVWFALLPLPFLSLRVCLIQRTMLLGPYFYIVFSRNKVLLRFLLFSYLCFRFTKTAFFGKSYVGLDLWASYSWYNPQPGYFWEHFFR